MKTRLVLALLGSLALVACKKKEEPVQEPAAPAPAVAAAAAAPAPEPVVDEEAAKKKALLDYATMEDNYRNDAKGQWAV